MDEWQEVNDQLDGEVLEIVEAAQGVTLTGELITVWAAHSLGRPVLGAQVTHSLRRLTDAGVITKRTAKRRRFYLDMVAMVAPSMAAPPREITPPPLSFIPPPQFHTPLLRNSPPSSRNMPPLALGALALDNDDRRQLTTDDRRQQHTRMSKQSIIERTRA